jgi:Calx-beta domain/Right handed beta helix region
MRTRALIAGCLAAASLAAAQPAAAATTRLVDDDGAATPTNCNGGAGGSAFVSISAAVAAATGGDTIKVCPGTYNEQVVVNKSLALTGAQAGVDARDPGRTGAAGTESIVRGATSGGQTTPFDVTASGVTLDGFTIQDQSNAGNLGFGIVLSPGTSGDVVRNNVVQNNIAGLALGSDNTTIRRNAFRNNNQSGPISGTGIYTDQFDAGGALTDVVIDDNEFVGNQNAGVLFGSTSAAQGASGVTVSGNTFTGNGNGFLAFNWTASTFARNLVSGSLGSQVVLGGGVAGSTLAENVITGGSSRGIRVGDFGGGGTNSSIAMRCNSISGNASAGLEIDSSAGSYTGSLDAAVNWWGSASGPQTAANPGGGGQPVVDPQSQVVFTPFLTSDADADPGTPGLQCMPSISVGDATVSEGNGGTTTVAVAVTLDVPSLETVTVGFATADATAVAGSDYSNTSDTVTFAPGERSKTVNVPVIGDTDVEADETFAGKLLSPSNARIADGQAVVTITNDDADTTAPVASRLKVSPARFRPEKGATVRYTLSEPATTTFTVQRRVNGRRFKRVRGSIQKQGAAGPNAFIFKGRIGGRKLAAGSYRLTAVPKDAAGNVGRKTRTTFNVKR